MLKQEYRCGIYCSNRAEPQDARLLDEVRFTVKGADKQALGKAADKKLDEINRGLKDGQFIDDIRWGDPAEVTPGDNEEDWLK